MGEQSFFVIVASTVALAVEVRDVASISGVDRATPVPGAPPHVLGVVASGERVVVQIDLANLLGIGDGDHPAEMDPLFRRTLFVSAGELEAALVCDRVRGLVRVDAGAVRDPAVLQGAQLRPFLTGEIDDPQGVVGVLDLPGLLRAAAVP